MTDLKNKRIVITGGSGSIGTHLIEMLDKSNKILNIDIKKPDKHLKKKLIHKSINIIDNYKINDVISEFKPQILFHLAAEFQRTKESYDFRNACFSTNLIGTHNVFESCIKNSIEHIIFPSSYLIYDPHLYLFSKENISENPVQLYEDSNINPRNITGAAKLYSERELEFYNDHGITTTSLRIFRVYGSKNKDIIDRWIRNLLKRKKIKVYGVDQEFDFVHAKDVASGCLKAAQSKKNGIFNIGYGKPISIEKVLKILKNKFKSSFITEKLKREESFKFEKSFANIEKSKNLLDYNPKISIESGIDLNINSIKKMKLDG